MGRKARGAHAAKQPQPTQTATDEDQLDEILAEHEGRQFLMGLITDDSDDSCLAPLHQARDIMAATMKKLHDTEIPHHRGEMMQSLAANKHDFQTLGSMADLPTLLFAQVFAIASCLAFMIDAVYAAFYKCQTSLLDAITAALKQMRQQNLMVMRSTTARAKELQAQLNDHSTMIIRLENAKALEKTEALQEQLRAVCDDVRHLRNTVDVLQELALGRHTGRHRAGPPTHGAQSRGASRDSRGSVETERTVQSQGSHRSVQSIISDAQLVALDRRGITPAWQPGCSGREDPRPQF
jgi:hypothetical protein